MTSACCRPPQSMWETLKSCQVPCTGLQWLQQRHRRPRHRTEGPLHRWHSMRLLPPLPNRSGLKCSCCTPGRRRHESSDHLCSCSFDRSIPMQNPSHLLECCAGQSTDVFRALGRRPWRWFLQHGSAPDCVQIARRKPGHHSSPALLPATQLTPAPAPPAVRTSQCSQRSRCAPWLSL